MATRENAATAKGDTATTLSGKLRPTAPEIRTSEQLLTKHEQLFDAQDMGSVTPKQAEQMNMTLKGIIGLASLELKYLSLVAKLRKAAPVPRNPILRTAIGLPAVPHSGDRASLLTTGHAVEN